MDSREIIRRLERDGWFEVAHVGSHKQFKHPGRSIEKQAGIRLR